MKRLLSLTLTLLCLGFFSACESSVLKTDPQIGVTDMGDQPEEGSDELARLQLEELPMELSLPSGWTFIENPVEYTLWFDRGLTGSISIDKKIRTEDSEDLLSIGSNLYHGTGLYTYCQENRCLLRLSEGRYVRITLSDKGMSKQRRTEMELILASFELINPPTSREERR